MNRDEAITLLRGGPEGIKEWNRQRSEGASLPDLDVLSLKCADLRGVNLAGINIEGGAFDSANLSGADLSRSHILGTRFYKANLSKTNFNNTSFTSAGFTGAKLIEADLQWASFIGCEVEKANFSRAKYRMTTLSDMDLSMTKGLASVVHLGPSTIGIDTLISSRGQIPLAFLRGCGLPHSLIEKLGDLLNELAPTQFYSCFISYSHKDEEFAQRIYSQLCDENLRVWYAPEDIKGGEKIHEQILHAISAYDKLLLVLSEHSMSSEWVKTEIRKAKQTESRGGKRKLFPIRLVPFETISDWECFDADSGKDLGVEVREYFIPDFSSWKNQNSFQTAFTQLIRDLTAEEPTR